MEAKKQWFEMFGSTEMWSANIVQVKKEVRKKREEKKGRKEAHCMIEIVSTI